MIPVKNSSFANTGVFYAPSDVTLTGVYIEGTTQLAMDAGNTDIIVQSITYGGFVPLKIPLAKDQPLWITISGGGTCSLFFN